MTARILIVEDDPDMRALLEEELALAGYGVVSAANGEDALERLDGVDAVVTDRIMPRLGGDALLREVLQHEPAVPVVLITAFGTIESAVQSVKAGAFDYVAKPFRMEVLLDTVARAVAERRARLERLEAAQPASASKLPPLVEVEREHILRALEATGGNKARAARILGMDRKTLYRKLDQYGLERHEE